MSVLEQNDIGILFANKHNQQQSGVTSINILLNYSSHYHSPIVSY